MTALADIKKRLGQLPPVPAGCQRAILVGISAERSITAERHIQQDRRGGGLPGRLFDIECLPTLEFDGWAIRDIDPLGQWNDIEVL